MTKYIIAAKLPRYLRPCYLNTNQTGSGWSRKATAERFSTRSAAEARIAVLRVEAGSTLSIVEVTR